MLSLLVVLLLSGAVSASDPPPRYQVTAFDGWDWAARSSSSSPGESLENRIAAVLDRHRSFLGAKRHGRPLIILARDRDQFQEALRHYGGKPAEDWATAVAFPAKAVVILDGHHLGRHPITSVETLSHEIAHVVLHEAGGKLPRWYHEGLAQWLAGQRLTIQTRKLLSIFSRTGGSISFEELDSFLPMRHTEATLLYGQCLSFVRFLSMRWGNGVHQKILERTLEGVEFNTAFREVTGVELLEAESSWRATLPFASDLLAFILDEAFSFRGLALLVLIAFIVQKVLRGRALKRMSEEEESNPGDGPGVS